VQGLLGLTLWYTGTYTYDGSGNVWKMTNGSNIDTFTYDKVSRLREGKIISVAKKQCQSFDAFGNIKGQATVASSQTCTPSSWSVDSATNRMGSPVTYDAAGEQLSWNSGAYVYWWYPTGQVRQFDSSGRVTIHGYSADGERVVTYDSSLAGITYTLRGLDAKVLRVYREASGVWTWIQDYVYRDGAHLATVDSAGTRHFHLDHLGSIRLITNSSGSQVALHTYYPFGQEATSTGQDNERMKFTGHERDLRDTSVTTDDLDYMHARYYNPNLGRFLSTDLLRGDPHEPQSFHLFAYVQNNPITYVDPFGFGENPNDPKGGSRDSTWTIVCFDKNCYWVPPGTVFVNVTAASWFWDPARILEYHRLRFGSFSGIPAGRQVRRAQSPENTCLPENPSDEGCTSFCLKEALGIHTAIGGGLIVGGSESIGKVVHLGGATEGTSVFSSTLGSWLPTRTASTWAPVLGHWSARSAGAGRIVARWLPWVGWGLLAGDVASFGGCLATCTGSW